MKCTCTDCIITASELDMTKTEYDNGIRMIFDMIPIFDKYKEVLQADFGIALNDSILTLRYIIEALIILTRENANMEAFFNTLEDEGYAYSFASWAGNNFEEQLDAAPYVLMTSICNSNMIQDIYQILVDTIMKHVDTLNLDRKLVMIPLDWDIRIATEYDLHCMKLMILI